MRLLICCLIFSPLSCCCIMSAGAFTVWHLPLPWLCVVPQRPTAGCACSTDSMPTTPHYLAAQPRVSRQSNSPAGVLRNRRQYDIVIVDQVSVVIPLLHLLTSAKVRPACKCLGTATDSACTVLHRPPIALHRRFCNSRRCCSTATSRTCCWRGAARSCTRCTGCPWTGPSSAPPAPPTAYSSTASSPEASSCVAQETT